MRVLIFGKGGISGGIREALPDHTVMELSKDSCDVRSTAQIRHSVERLEPDWIINCAGISEPHAPSAEILTNLVGSINVAQQSGDLPIIFLASVAGLYGKPGHLGYSASKAGVISVMQSLAAEGRQAYAISPGRVDTPLRERDYPNDTPGSRLKPITVGYEAKRIIDGEVPSGTNLIIRKIGLGAIWGEAHTGNGWKEKLRVGGPVTI